MNRITTVGMLTLAALGLLATGCSLSTHRATTDLIQFSEHIPGSPVMVETRNGSIKVTADAAVSEVQVSAKITCGGQSAADARDRLAQASIAIDRGIDRTLSIRPIFPEPPMWGDGATFVVRLPDSGSVKARTSNGRVTITKLHSPVDVRTSNGRITIRDQKGDAILQTSNGSITVERHEGLVDAVSSNGTVRVIDHLGRVEAESSNGRIEVVLRGDASGPVTLRTSNGSIRASVGTAFSGEVAMSTSNSGISVLDHAGAIRTQLLSRTHGKVVIGDGGEPSQIRTSNGRIELIVRDE